MSDDADLFDDTDAAPAEEPDLGPFADAAAAHERKGRGGRPPGSTNKHTKDFEKYYYAQGFTDPLVGMARFLTADPVTLQAWFAEHDEAMVAVGKQIRPALPTLIDIIKQQHWCAKELAPYLHGKKPTQLEIIDERLPTLILNLGGNQADQARRVRQGGQLSAGTPLIEQDPDSEEEE